MYLLFTYKMGNFSANALTNFVLCRNKSKKEGKDQESAPSSTTPNTGYQWESESQTRAKRSAIS